MGFLTLLNKILEGSRTKQSLTQGVWPSSQVREGDHAEIHKLAEGGTYEPDTLELLRAVLAEVWTQVGHASLVNRTAEARTLSPRNYCADCFETSSYAKEHGPDCAVGNHLSDPNKSA